MAVLPYQLIKGKGYITPEVEKTVAFGMSYGLSACGYDVRAAKTIWLWPFWGRLNVTVERFEMPNDLVALVRDKSTWARRFVFVQNTVIEPGWKGYLTLELTRFLPWPVKIEAGMPIAQIMFEELVEPTEKPYGKSGKYQDQPPVPVAAIAEKHPLQDWADWQDEDISTPILERKAKLYLWSVYLIYGCALALLLILLLRPW